MSPAFRKRRRSGSHDSRRSRRLDAPRVSFLEDRTLLSAVARVADVRAAGGSLPLSMTAAGGFLYFSADDGVAGRELWRHDPATNTTTRVADINPGPAGSIDNVDEPFTVIGNQIFFVANDGATGRELWRHDASINLTTRVADIRAGSSDSDIDTLIAVAGKLYFSANDGVVGQELWRYDPATNTASLASDLRPGSSGSFPSQFATLDGKLYLSALSATAGTELWRYDPATGLSAVVADVNPGAPSSTPTQLTAFNGQLYFTADGPTGGRELYRHDPPTNTTSLTADINPGAASSTPLQLVGAGTKLYFRADDGATGREMWSYDPATNTTAQVADIRAGATSTFGLGDSTPVVAAGKLYFAADDGVTGRELWWHDPTTGVTSLLADLNFVAGSDPNALRVLDGQIYFNANDGVAGAELWRHDPTAGTTVREADISSSGSSAPAGFTLLDGRIYFRADDGTTGFEPWVLRINHPPLANNDTYTIDEDGLLASDPGISSVPAATTGAGRVVHSADRVATFSGVVTGTNLGGYTENGLRISVNRPAFVDLTEPGFSGGFHYPSGGAHEATSISTTDGSKLYAVEFNTANEWNDNGNNYIRWWMIRDGITIGTGTFSSPRGEVSGFSYAGGFDVLLVGAYFNPNDALNATPTSYQALALDNLKARTHINGVLSNDIDVDGDTLQAVLVNGPSHGSVTLGPQGLFTYTPAANYNGLDSFTYRATDGSLESNLATVSITVTAVDDAPVAVDDAVATPEDTPLILSQADLKGNDTDVDNTNAQLSVTAVSNPINGSVVLNANGTITFTPFANFFGIAGFTYTLSDGSLTNVPVGDHSGLVTVAVTSVNDAPVASTDGVTVLEDQLVTFDPRGNDGTGPANENGQTLSVTAVTQGAHGTVSFTAAGLTYTPNPDYFGSDSFTYTVTDNGTTNGVSDPKSSTGTVNVTVTPVNDAPSFTWGGWITVLDDSGPYSAPWATDISAGPANESGQTLSFQIIGSSNPGLFSVAPAISPTGTLTFTPRPGVTGFTSFWVVLRDNGGITGGGVDSSTTMYVRIYVNANPAPFVNFALAARDVNESAGTATVVVQLDRPAPANMLLPISVTSATAGPGDYTIGSASVFVPTGATSGSVSISVVDDTLNEATESLALALGTGSGFRLGAQTTHILSILDNDAPPTVAFTTASQAVSEVSVSATVKARLSAVSGRDVTIPLSLSNSATCSLGADYTLPGGLSIVIPAGSLEGSFTMNIVDDTAPEGNELIIVNMGTPVNATKSAAAGAALAHTVTIAANDAPSASFMALSKTFSEGDTYTLTAVLSQPTPFPVTIELVPDTTYAATHGTDYALSSTMITIPANQPSGSVTLSVLDDGVGELGENFRIAMGAMTNAVAGRTWNFLGTIAPNNRPTIEFVSSSSTVWEDDGSNGTVLTISAKLSNASSQPISVQVQVVDGQLTTSDYSFTDFSFDFPGDSVTTTATVSVTIAKDAVNEPTEWFDLRFGTPTGPVDFPSTSGTSTWKHTVSIKDNDPLVSFQPFVTKTTATTPAKTASPTATTVEQSVGEGDGFASFPVYISAPSNIDVTVPITYTRPKVNGAVRHTDYVADRTVTIPANDSSSKATLGMTIIDDELFGEGVSFTATLGAPTTTGGGVANPSILTTTIEENDFPVVYFTSKPATIREPSGSFRVDLTLTKASPLTVVVPIKLTGTARIGDKYDYTIAITTKVSVSGDVVTVIIPPNQTSASFTVNGKDDSLLEANETVVMTILSPTNATRNWRTKAYTLTIESDDFPGGYEPPPTTTIVDSGPLIARPGVLDIQTTKGYVSGSFVFFDANKNGVRDFLDLDADGIQGPDEPNEPSATTQINGLCYMSIPEDFDLNGDGVINPEEGRLVAIGGVDTASGTVMSSPLVAPGGSFVVSPFTSVMSALVENHGMTLEQAAARVREALGIPEEVDLTRFDPIAATLEGSVDGAIVFAADSQLSDTVEQVMSLVGGALAGIPLDFLANVAYGDLAAKIVEQGSILDLSEAVVAEALIQGVLYETGILLDPAIVEGAAKVIAEGNKQIDALEKTATEGFLESMSKVQKVAQKSVATKLTDLGAGLVGVEDILASSTGQALTDLIAATPANDVVPSAILISDVTHVETDSGDVVYEFTATLDRPSTQTVSVGYETVDSTATLEDGDYEAASGVLAWAPGDTSPRTFQVLVHGDAVFEGDEAFLVFLSRPENAIASRGIVRGTIADDDPFVYTAPADDGDNQIRLSIEGDSLTLERNDEIVFAGALSSPVPITIIGADGVTNSLIVDLIDSGGFLAAGISFQGGDLSSDSLTVLDGTASRVTHAYGGHGAGTLTIDGAPISYSGVETVIDSIAEGIGGLPPFVSEGSPLTLAVLGFDPDNSATLTYDWSLTRNGQPFASGTGPDFTGAVGDDGDYTVTLTSMNTDNGAVGATVASFVVTNTPPTVVNDIATTNEDTPVTIAVLANDSDSAGASDPLTISAVTQGSHGSVVINANGTLTYTPNANFSGSDSFTYTVSDGDGGSVTAAVDVTVVAVADNPTVTATSPGGVEGSPFPVVITPGLVDTDGSEVLFSIRVRGVPIGASFNHGALIGTFGGLDVWGLTPADLPGLTLTVPDGPATVGLTVTAFSRETSNGSTAESSTSLAFQVANVAPDATLTGPASGALHAVGETVTFTASFTDPALGLDVYSATWEFTTTGANGQEVQVTPVGLSVTVAPPTSSAPGTITATATFAQAGVYRVKLTLADGDGGQDVATFVNDLQAMVVVYDPSAGFVTGGGWLQSPPGAYVPNPTAVGKANFGFVSKYQQGATTPTGNTEFQFKAGNLNFQSTSYEWMVVAGAKAQYKGVGTVNGAPGYRFMLTVIDGQRPGGGGADKLRMRIWSDGGGLLYDNLVGSNDDNANPTTTLGGGSIVIHTSGSSLGAAPGGPAASTANPVTPETFAPLVSRAVAEWRSTGFETARIDTLGRIEFHLADLAPGLLGMASPETRVVWIDRDADGLGWFVDPTPSDDAEFAGLATRPTPEGVDLLTTLAHEIGHVLGLDHDDDETGADHLGVMAETLTAGVRSLPRPSDLPNATGAHPRTWDRWTRADAVPASRVDDVFDVIRVATASMTHIDDRKPDERVWNTLEPPSGPRRSPSSGNSGAAPRQ